MEVVVKKLTAFRLNNDLLDMLKSAAKREHRSLNNFVECLLMDAMYSEPNEETKAAIEEVRAVLAAKSENGKRKEVKDLLFKYDSGKLSGVKKSDYTALLADAEAL